MRKYAWIWLAGCLAWSFDAVVNLTYRNLQHAELAIIVAVLFGIAYAFYASQRR